MELKSKDITYCSVNKEKIEKAQPILLRRRLELFLGYMRDRQQVYINKTIKDLPAPWTENKILQTYKFTNVRREDDRVSCRLIELVSKNPKLSFEDKVLNSVLFRAWNNPDTFLSFGGPWTAEEIYNGIELKESVRPYYVKMAEAEPDRKWFSNAYNQGGTKRAWRTPNGDGHKVLEETGDSIEPDIPLRVFHIGPWYKKRQVVQKLLQCESQQEAYDTIKSVQGFASFLAYQVFVDLTYIEDFPFSENEFTVAGPGCKHGMDLLFKDFDGLTYEEALFWLRDNWEFINQEVLENKKFNPKKMFAHMPIYDQQINIMSLENCFCEFSKYMRIISGAQSRTRRYK